jgi:coiled-coil domain-containing protein 130
MAERKAVNKYYPPDWRPEHGSINKYVGSHPLRERARKLNQGIMIVRFEMPFNIWCGGCEQHIGRGVRFNAEKKQCGMYFSTKLWSFRMRCHLCSNWIEIKTDPEHCDYVVVGGGRRKVETWEGTPEDHAIELKSKEEAQKLAEDPFYKLEHATEDKKKATESAPVIDRLQKMMEPMYDDYALSQKLRKRFREEKKEIEKAIQEGKAKGLAANMPLLPLTDEDKELVSKVNFKNKTKETVDDRRAKERLLIRSSSIFDKLSKTNNEPKDIKFQAALKKRKIDPSLFRKPSTTSNSNNHVNLFTLTASTK